MYKDDVFQQYFLQSKGQKGLTTRIHFSILDSLQCSEMLDMSS